MDSVVERKLISVFKTEINIHVPYCDLSVLTVPSLIWNAVIVHGLPSSASWQDLKANSFYALRYFFHSYLAPVASFINFFQDHMRKAGDVCFADVSRDSEGMYTIILKTFCTLKSL